MRLYKNTIIGFVVQMDKPKFSTKKKAFNTDAYTALKA